MAVGSVPVLIPTLGNIPVRESRPVVRAGMFGEVSAPVPVPVCCSLVIDGRVSVCQFGSNSPRGASKLDVVIPLDANALFCAGCCCTSGPCRAIRNAVASSSAFVKRPPGRFAIDFSRTCSAASGNSGRNTRGEVGCVCNCCAAICIGVSPWNGVVPVTI